MLFILSGNRLTNVLSRSSSKMFSLSKNGDEVGCQKVKVYTAGF